ncbi:hypothetical protein F4779DRAFT_109518 [Xylariaceae sp. FL0662B]|nr:hypothetical protein F4779DRAFT_109518 [Xylariaceae sp. FL0662B]
MADVADVLASLPPDQRERMLNGPAAQPPAGTQPNFSNPENQNTMAFAVITAGMAISVLMVLLRACVRLFCIKKLYIEDVFVAAALGCCIAYDWSIYRIIATTGLLVHQWDIKLRALSDFLWYVYLGDNLYGPAILCLKTAILLEWARIFVPTGTRNPFFWTCHILLLLNVLFYGSSKVALNLICTPRQKIWDKTIQGGSCFDIQALTLATAISNFVSDFVILLAPQRVIWKLNMSFEQRLGVSIVFAMGILCVVIAGFRISSCLTYLKSSDIVYDASAVALWAHAEITILFLVVCVPSIPKAVGSIRPVSMYRSLKSWVTSLMRTGTGEGASWPRSTAKVQNNTSYRQIYEHSLEPIDGSRKALYVQNIPKTEVENGSILRTTHFIRTDEQDSSLSTNQYFRQHPWVQDNTF